MCWSMVAVDQSRVCSVLGNLVLASRQAALARARIDRFCCSRPRPEDSNQRSCTARGTQAQLVDIYCNGRNII